MLNRILKMLAALGTGVGVTLVTQFLLPPAFIHSYGVALYGEWLVLSATLNYLTTLTFGITTYASNELTMMRQRGDMRDYERLQGSTLALLLGMLCIGLTICSIILLLPLSNMLHLNLLSRWEACLIAFFLGLQALTHILAGYYNGLFMVVEETHRGTSWYNWRRLSATLVALPLILLHARFSVVALGQLIGVLLVTLASIYDLRLKMPNLPLGLSGADWQTAKATLKPSGMFAMIYTQNFLVFQLPVILLQRLVGSESVVLFTISRTILSTARQLLQSVTSAIAPEITFSFGTGDMKRLLAIFHYSEKVVFSLIPVANLGSFLFAPILLNVWLHKPQLFNPYVYGLMALVSAAMSMREHKQYFQFATNTHKRLSIIVFFGNVLMTAVSIPATVYFGTVGFMWVWLISETSQMALLYRENKKLFNNDPSISITPVVKLVAVLLISLPVCVVLVNFGESRSLPFLALVAVGGILLLSVESYLVFGLDDVRLQLQRKLQATAQ